MRFIDNRYEVHTLTIKGKKPLLFLIKTKINSTSKMTKTNKNNEEVN